MPFALHVLSCLFLFLSCHVLPCLSEIWMLANYPTPWWGDKRLLWRKQCKISPLPYVLLAINHRNTTTFFRHFSSFFLFRLSVETVIMASLSLKCIELSIIPFIISLTLKKNDHVVRVRVRAGLGPGLGLGCIRIHLVEWKGSTWDRIGRMEGKGNGDGVGVGSGG
jgi:hypothetical protein